MWQGGRSSGSKGPSVGCHGKGGEGRGRWGCWHRGHWQTIQRHLERFEREHWEAVHNKLRQRGVGRKSKEGSRLGAKEQGGTNVAAKQCIKVDVNMMQSMKWQRQGKKQEKMWVYGKDYGSTGSRERNYHHRVLCSWLWEGEEGQ